MVTWGTKGQILILLLSITLATGSVRAQGISGMAANEILDRYLQGDRLNTDKARRELETALDLYRRSSDAPGQAKSLVLLGMAHDTAGRHSEAMASYAEAQRVLEVAGDRFGAAIVGLHMGDSETRAKRSAAAKEHFERALRQVAALEKSGEALSSEMLIFFLRFLGIPPELFEGGKEGIGSFVDQIRPLFLQMLKLDIELRLGESLLALADCAGARTLLEQTRKQVAGLRISQIGWLLAQIFEGQVENVWKQLEKTCGAAETSSPEPLPRSAAVEFEELHQESEEARRKGDLGAEAELLARRASVLQFWGDFEGAAADFERSLEIVRKLPDLRRQARAEDALGVHLLLWNRYEDALGHLGRALETYRRTRSELDVAVTLTYLGSANAVLGFHRIALDRLTEARRLALKHKSSVIESEALYALVETQSVLGAPREALALLREHISTAASRGGPIGELKAQTTLAALLVRLGEDQEAERHASEALALAEGLGISQLEASARVSLAQIVWRRGFAAEAFLHLDRVREIHQANGWRYLEAASSALKALWLCQQGRTAEGIALYRQAIDLYEGIQSTLRVPDLLSGLNDQSGYRLYDRFLHLLAAEGLAEEAFQASERARARAFLNMLGNRRLGRAESAQRELLARAEDLRNRLRGLEASLQGPNMPPLKNDARLRELTGLRDEYSQVLLRLKLADPEYAELVQVETINLSELRQHVLAPDVSLVEFFVTDESTLVWVIDRETFRMVEIKQSRGDLRKQVEELRRLLDPAIGGRGAARGNLPLRPSAEALFDEKASGLYRLLIAPLKPYLRHKRLMIIPHDALHYLPFAALWNAEGKSYLIQEFTLSYAPSASVLPHLRAKQTPGQGRALVMGDPALGPFAASLPPLSAARQEAEDIAKLLGSSPALGIDATESLIDEWAGKIDLLHLAAHGIYNSESPSYSRVELAADRTNDGHLEVHELMSRVDLRGVDLVIVSACDSGLGDRSNGDEIVGLSRAFLYAGSPGVISTLWKIHDAAAGVLMKTFYRHLLDSAPAPEALRQAQISLLENPRYRHPYHWAAFGFTGDPQGRWRQPADGR